MRAHSHYLSSIALALALALAGAGAFLGAPLRASAATPAAGAAQAEPQRVLDYWTPERMAQAQPRDYVRDPATDRLDRAPRSQGAVKAQPWNGGGLVEKTTGKAFFVINGNWETCSGSVVTDSSTGTSLVLTAAHCVYDNATGAFADYWMFIPDFDARPLNSCADTAYGCWTAQAFTVSQDYTDQRAFNDIAAAHDVAFVTVGPSYPDGSQLDATVGAQPVDFSAREQGTYTYLFGYPTSRDYIGFTLVYSAGRLRFDHRMGNETYRMGSFMAAGNSGGPWYTGFDPQAGTGVTMSVTSYGYANQPFMYGPIFDGTTATMHTVADGAEGIQIVS